MGHFYPIFIKRGSDLHVLRCDIMKKFFRRRLLIVREAKTEFFSRALLIVREAKIPSFFTEIIENDRLGFSTDLKPV